MWFVYVRLKSCLLPFFCYVRLKSCLFVVIFPPNWFILRVFLFASHFFRTDLPQMTRVNCTRFFGKTNSLSFLTTTWMIWKSIFLIVNMNEYDDWYLLPSLDFAKIECDRSVGKRLLAQVLGVTSHKGWHVVTLKREKCKYKTTEILGNFIT